MSSTIFSIVKKRVTQNGFAFLVLEIVLFFLIFFFESEFNTTRVTAAHAMGNDILESSSN